MEVGRKREVVRFHGLRVVCEERQEDSFRCSGKNDELITTPVIGLCR